MKSAVATGHHLTSQAALDILTAGGNAVDATIAAYTTACIAEPCMASMAAGGFAMIYFENKAHCLDFFCQTPGQKIDHAKLDPIPVDFGTAQEEYFSGIGSVAVPGATMGLFAMHQRFGSMPLKEIFSIARTHCREGVALTPFQALDLILLKSVFGKEKRGREVFCHDDDVKKEGDCIRMEKMDDFLEVLAIEGSDLVYRGEVAKNIDDLSRELGGHISYDDLANYKAVWRVPHRLGYKKAEILIPPAPSMGHALLQTFMTHNVDETKDLINVLHDKNQAFRQLLTRQEVLFAKAGLPFSGQKKFTGTSHMNILDGAGNGVAMTFSIGEGSGIFIKDTDMHLNNMLGEPSLLPDGLDSWYTNTRLASMMTPAMIFEDQQLRYMLGTGGAERIASMLAQTIMRLFDEEMSLDQAVNAPRTYLSRTHFEIEPGFTLPNPIPDNFRVWEKPSMYFGGIHGIQLPFRDISQQAVGDQRREGNGVVA